MDRKRAKLRYNAQKSGAKTRGIEWRFSFESWLEFWGEDLDRRGPGRDQLCMQRPHDKGPYSPENCIKDVPKRNMKTMGLCRQLKTALKAKAQLEAERDASPTTDKEWVDLTDDERELRHMFGLRSSRRMGFRS